MQNKSYPSLSLRLALGLLLGLGSLTAGLAQDGIYYAVKLLPDKVTYQVSLSSTIGLSGISQTTNSGQVTLVVPTGSFQVSTIQSVNGIWTNNTTIRAPSQSPGYDYFIFGMSPTAPLIPYSATQETILFTFVNNGTCAGPVEVWTKSDPFKPDPPRQPINVGNDLTALGFRNGTTLYNAWNGNYNVGGANCSTATLPTVAILSPTASSTAMGPTVPISGTATASAAVSVSENGNLLCSTTATTAGTWTCMVSLPDGVHTLQAISRNTAGSSSPATTSFTVVSPVNCKPICVPITISIVRRRR
ncbi:hypothetical protein GCM10028806_37510 [Spirosoma terrae]|uniref:Uncharacterized protein n=1 Tax=Spirosoma terrae TaxID=1968276 RepID=A0A6L9LET5_9BACT|nr:Ig-like domain-containing protein [Spirosoma terrae]NDU98870.1 hypothetical protein [Spirosoma terrae]